MCLVPTADDQRMVDRHAPMVIGTYFEPAIIPLLSRHDGEMRYAGLLRGLRDVRGRMARRRYRWRDVSLAGMAGGDGKALVLITHEGVDRRKVQDVLCHRWPMSC